MRIFANKILGTRSPRKAGMTSCFGVPKVIE
jgi:hypothetical protein